MWNYIKRGFGYGFGGRIGWEFGGLVWRWARRAVLAVVAVVVMQCTGKGMEINKSVLEKHHQQIQQDKLK